MEPELASRVCAGEVITRPVNAVKELIENSLDSGATKIRVDLLNGGKRSILVADNGSGMSPGDLSLCLKRHATSKLSAMEDFAKLTSYGFRGEALASMSAVARVRIESRIAGQECGYKVLAQGDREEKPVPSPREQGTSIELRDLFHTIPARLRFLKSDQYEKSLVVDLMQSFMAIFPGVAFELFHHSERILFSSGEGQSLSLFQDILGIGPGETLLEIERASHPILGMKIHGFLTGPTLTRSTSRHLRVFVNKRIVKHSPLVRAIHTAYDSLLGHKRWPLGFFFVEVPPRMIDSNVHPMKTEVRIENESILEEFMTKKIRTALLRSDLSTPLSLFPPKGIPSSVPKGGLETIGRKVSTSNSALLQPSLVQHADIQPVSSPEVPAPLPRSNLKEIAPGLELEVGGRTREFLQTQAHPACPSQSQNAEVPSPNISTKPLNEVFPIDQIEIIGQLDSTFILGEIYESMIIIDQHVAQERILFEEYFSRMRKKCSSSIQYLLAPPKIALSPKAKGILSEAGEALENLGFSLDFKGEDVLVSGVPDIFQGKVDAEFLEEIVNGFERGFASDKLEDYFRNIAAMMACKGSVKAGDLLSKEEMSSLLRALSRCENPYSCPHGRPIVVKISLREICSRFQRPYVSKKTAPCRH